MFATLLVALLAASIFLKLTLSMDNAGQLRLSPEEAAEKWSRRTRQAVEDYRRGVDAVREAPGAAAARNADAALANFTEAINSGRWARRVSGVSLEDWKRSASTKGAARIPQGVEDATPRTREAFRQVFPAIEAAAEAARRMPNTTLEDRIQRSVTFMRELHQRAPSRQGR